MIGIVVVTHGDQFGSPTPDILHREFPDAEIVVYGHTHKPLLELVDNPVAVDPDDALRARALELGWPVISLR